MNEQNISGRELDEALASVETSTFKADFEKDDKKAGVFKVAKHLIAEFNPKTIRGMRRELFVYEDGMYIPGEDILKAEIRHLLEEACTSNYSKEIIDAVKDLTIVERSAFKTETRLINLKNGTLDFTSGELLKHSSDFLFMHKIPINYDADAECPTVRRYLSDVLDDEQIQVIQEWFGYALYREYSFKKALICVGEGDTGKTTLINLFFAFLGERNVSGVSLQKISSDKFAASHLYEKHINLYDDLSVRDINDNGAFKIATGGGVITGEKKFGDQFQFKNYAKLTFACNQIPDVKDANDDAYFRRWIVVQFNRIVEEEKKDPGLIQKLSTEQELSGLLNFALEGLRRLLERQKFSYDKDASEIKTEMLRSGSVVARFGYDCLEQATGEHVRKEDMYSAFTQYAAANRLPAVSQKDFSSRLKVCFPYIAEYRPKTVSGKQTYSWRNVRLKPDEQDDMAPEEEDELQRLFDEVHSQDSQDLSLPYEDGI